MERVAFHIKTEAYEGPFELILELIEKSKLSINELSLAQVTDDYIAHVRGHGTFPMEDAAEFIGVAATLLLIKSKSLIPELELTGEEEEDMNELERRLKEYERVREMMKELSKIFGRRVMVSAGEKAPEVVFAPARDFTLEKLESALLATLAALEKEEQLPEARVRPTVTIEEMMESLVTRVKKAMTISFKEFSANTREKVEVIVSFLALLELVKDGIVSADQQGSFADITITNTSAGVPHYG